MARKTERMYASAGLQGDDWTAASHSIALALQNLASVAHADGREALFDTLDVSIERQTMDDRSFADASGPVATYATITVSAEAVKVSETIRHNHFTRDIKPLGQCPACDQYHDQTTKRNE